MEAFFPDFVITSISMLNCFSFKLPITALGITGDTVIEVVVEYEPSGRPGELAANAWARESGGTVGDYLSTVYAKTEEGNAPLDQAERIFEELNRSQFFNRRLCGFARTLAEKQA